MNKILFHNADRTLTIPHKKELKEAIAYVFKHEKVLFITEDLNHIISARQLGMKAIHVKGAGQDTGDVDNLLNIIPLVQAFIND